MERSYLYVLFCTLYIPAQVLWTCEGHRCELSHLCTPWPGACHLGSMPYQTPKEKKKKKEEIIFLTIYDALLP